MTDIQWKTLWRDTTSPTHKNAEGLKPMLQARTRTVFKQVRRQLLWEVCTFSIILIFYYDAFDGARKPIYANIVLVAAVLAVLIHSLLGYQRFQPVGESGHLRDALEKQLKRLRVYAIYSILSRGAWTIALAVFFSATITVHGWAFAAAIGATLAVQAFWLSRIWGARIRVLRDAVKQVSA
jgi:hypothetical protein